jgi:hypothetical protein
MDPLITITNNGPLIAATNYFASPLALRGLLYASINAGAVRLLIPWPMQSLLDEIGTATHVIMSRAPWPAQGLPDAIEILFEDGTDSPYALQLSPQQLDRLPAPADAGRPDLLFSAWVDRDGQPHRAVNLPLYYRTAEVLPCLRPWKDDHA